jgi:hypothetical protein
VELEFHRGVDVRRADDGRAAVDGPAGEHLVRGGRVPRRRAGAARGRVEPNRPTKSLLPARARAGAPAAKPFLSARAPLLLSFVRDSGVLPCHCRNLQVFQSSSQVQPFRQWLWPTAGNNLGTIHALCCFVGKIPNQ